jgi:hypothetical protein
VVFNAGEIPAADTIVTIIRTVPMTQVVDYVENDKFPAGTHEEALDKLTMLIQQLNEMYARAVILAVESGYADLTMPDPVAGYFLQWKTDLSGLQNALALETSQVSITPYMETLLDDANVATAKQTLEMSPGAIRAVNLQIGDGAGANTVVITATDLYNGDPHSVTGDIAKGATQDGYTLNAGGNQLTLESALFSGTVEGVLGAIVGYNDSKTDTFVRATLSAGKILLVFTTAPEDGGGAGTSGGGASDLPALMDHAGASAIHVTLVYATS